MPTSESQPRYRQAELPVPFERFNRYLLLPLDQRNIRFSVATSLEQAGHYIHVDFDNKETAEDYREYVPVRASNTGIESMQHVLQDPQVAAMVEAQEFIHSGLHHTDGFRELRQKLESFAWPNDFMVDQLMIQAYDHASQEKIRSSNLARVLQYNYGGSEGHRKWIQDSDRFGGEFTRESRQLESRIPYHERTGVSGIRKVVSDAITRVFTPTDDLLAA